MTLALLLNDLARERRVPQRVAVAVEARPFFA